MVSIGLQTGPVTQLILQSLRDLQLTVFLAFARKVLYGSDQGEEQIADKSFHSQDDFN